MISFFTGSGGAGKIRGEQIANRIGAKLNPKIGFKDDICIYVKTSPPFPRPERTYIDVVEYSDGYKYVLSCEDVEIIASSKSIYKYLSHRLVRNDIVFIPQHHCNFERVRRTRKEVRIVGIIGNKFSFQFSLERLRKKLEKIGMELNVFIKKSFRGREEVADFYKQIDIQLVWRPQTDGILRNPLKITNANSFGIPTVAYPEETFIEEYDGRFIPVKSIQEMVDMVAKLKNNPEFYDHYANLGLEIANNYHIDAISKLYLKL